MKWYNFCMRAEGTYWAVKVYMSKVVLKNWGLQWQGLVLHPMQPLQWLAMALEGTAQQQFASVRPTPSSLGQHLSALLKSLLVVVSLVSVTHPDCPQGENPICLHAPLRPVLAPGCQTPDLGRLKGDRAKPWSKYIASDVVQALLVRLSSNFSNSEEKASGIN